MEKQIKVGISGSYGGLNLGDEAILQSIVQGIRSELDAHVTVFSKNVSDTINRHKVERAIPVRELSRNEMKTEIARLDVLILGGGGILFDQEVDVYLREVSLAHELGTPVFVYGISAGPLEIPENRKAVAKELNKVYGITVRDRLGKHLLEEVGVKKDIFVGADPALLIKPERLSSKILKQEGIDGQKPLVGISIREPGPAAPDMEVEHYHSLLANVADFMVERLDAQIIFVPMERMNKDIQHSHGVISKMFHAHRASVLKEEYTPSQLLSVIGNFDFAIGMRLHFLIFAALMGVPFVALPYAGKVTGFIEALGLKSPPLDKVTVGRLIAYVDSSWDKRESLREQILAMTPQLKEQAKKISVSFCELAQKLQRLKSDKEENHARFTQARH